MNRLGLDTDLDCLSKLSLRCQCDLSTSKSASNDRGITVITIPPNKLGAGSSLLHVHWVTLTDSLVFIHHFRPFFSVICSVNSIHSFTHCFESYSWTFACATFQIFDSHMLREGYCHRAVSGNIDNQGQNEMWALLFVLTIGLKIVHAEREPQAKITIFGSQWTETNCKGLLLLTASEY